jgi:hypothetical protein
VAGNTNRIPAEIDTETPSAAQRCSFYGTVDFYTAVGQRT